MKQSKILLDTCSYLRLAKNIYPLLKQIFGDNNFCLYITKEFQKEYEKSSRLQNKFEWVNTPEFVENRNKPINISKKERKEIEKTFEFLLYEDFEGSENISKTDLFCLSYAYVLKIPIVTDDGNMLKIAKELNIKTYKTLELLKLMLDNNHISINNVRATVSYWAYINDLPGDFKKDYKKIFSEEPPQKSYK
jgi:predicted nucleic acid-binding protein